VTLTLDNINVEIQTLKLLTFKLDIEKLMWNINTPYIQKIMVGIAGEARNAV
jgi:hypothetical protein